MTISRIKTSTKDTKEAIVIVVDGKKLLISLTDLSTFNTVAKIESELEKQAGTSLPDIFIHKNRDGSIAIATGAAPDVWPEDWIEEKDGITS